MTELEKLRQQKKELEARIKELSSRETVCGRAKYGVEHYPTTLPDRHYIAVNTIHNRKQRWVSVISTDDMHDAVERIPEIIDSLQTLYDKLREEKGNGKTS